MKGDERPFVLGLTGGIGMGKSTVCGLFTERLGVPVIDSDSIVHSLYSEGGAAVEPIREVFPSAVKEQGVDRSVLSQLIQEEPARLQILENIVHPLVKKSKFQAMRDLARKGEQLIVLDIPLLYETRSEKMCDAVMVVSSPCEVQRQRVLARPGMTVEKLDAILSRQLPNSTRLEKADFIVDTNTELEETLAHVKSIVQGLRGRSGQTWFSLFDQEED